LSIDPDSAENELFLKFVQLRRNSASGSLIAKVGDQVIYSDTVNIAKAADREQFVAGLEKRYPSLDRRDVEEQLLTIVAKLGRDKTETDDQGTSAAADGDAYAVKDGRLCRMIDKGDGEPIAIPICNFDARIVEEVVRDDGVEQSRRLCIEGTLASGEKLPRVEVAPEEFACGNWTVTRWETRATIFVGPSYRDHLRAALQLRSGRVPRRTVHTAMGWHQADGFMAYVHAGGAIGPFGSLKNVSTDLPETLANFRLPDPPEGETLREGVMVGLDLLRKLVPDRVIFPLLAAVYRAVLPGVDYALHLAGRTGVFKTELAALAQQHYGAGMDARHLPASWSSTGNALEGLAFVARDAILVVDDFAPVGNAVDVNRYHREADRLIRAQGNRSGRQRLRPDGTPRPAKPPRGTILTTGEDIPKGHSLQARLLVVEVGRGDVQADRLTKCQRDAAAGRYATALTGYVQWLAGQYEQACADLKAEAEKLRAEIIAEPDKDSHRRTPTMVADLLAGFGLFLRFAQEIGALNATDARVLRDRSRAALLEVAAEQATHQGMSDPCDRFLALLRSVLSSGRACVASPTGECPETSPQACGWRVTGNPNDPQVVWQPQGRLIGWVDGANFYLDPEAAYAEVQRLGNEQNDSLTVSSRTLHKRLHERNYLASIDDRRKKLLIRRTIEKSRRKVLHLRAEHVLGLDSGGPKGPHGGKTRENTPSDGAPDPAHGPQPGAQDSDGSAQGPITDLGKHA
jgi:hypothetical protein